MKIPLFVPLLTAFLAFVLAGCSDDSAQPVSPTDQSAQLPPSLAKQASTEYTFTTQIIARPSMDPPVLCGNVWQGRDRQIVERFLASDPYLSGILEETFSTTIDAVTGEGPVHGKFKITPTNTELTGGGFWEGTFEGYRTGPFADTVWTQVLKCRARGQGGTIDGWQTASTINLTIYHTHPGIPEGVAPPYPIPTFWWGQGTGYYVQR